MEYKGGAWGVELGLTGARAFAVVDPLGTICNYSYGTKQGKLAVTGGSLPSGEGKSGAASRVQDANGLITSETDFKGYNANGDLLGDGLRSYTYDTEGRLAASTTGATDTSPTRASCKA